MSFTLTIADISGDTWSEEICPAPKVLGRDDLCEIRLEHGSVSRRHCRFWREQESCFVEDCGSRNGTFVNGLKVDRTRLHVGDTISVGRFDLILEFKEIAQRTVEILRDAEFPPCLHDARTEEQHLARVVHRRLNPLRRLHLPGMVAEVLYHPSGMLGGDTFETVGLKNRRVLALFDPMTHGVTAAMHSMLLRSELDRWIQLTEEPAKCLQRINIELMQLGVADLYVQAVIASWFPRNSTFVYAAAGGHPPLILRNGKVQNLHEIAGGLPLGVLSNEHYTESMHQLKRGDRIFFFSDGMGEALGEGEPSGLTGIDLATRLESYPGMSLAEQMRRILGNQEWDDPLDDILLVGAEIVPESESPETN